MLDDALKFDLATVIERYEGVNVETYKHHALKDLAEWRIEKDIICEAVKIDWGEGTGSFDSEAECWLKMSANKFLTTHLARERGLVRAGD